MEQSSVQEKQLNDILPENTLKTRVPQVDVSREIKPAPSRYRNEIAKFIIFRSDECVHCGKCAQFCPYGFLGLPGLFTPEMAGVFYAHFAVLNEKIDGFFSFSLNDKRVITGALELGSPEASDLRLGDASRNYGFPAHAMPGAAGQLQSGYRPQSEDQLVFGPQRVDSRREFFPEIIGDESGATYVPAAEHGVEFLHLRRPVR